MPPYQPAHLTPSAVVQPHTSHLRDVNAPLTVSGQPVPPHVLADLRTDHAGEVGAVCIDKGVLVPNFRTFLRRLDIFGAILGMALACLSLTAQAQTLDGQTGREEPRIFLLGEIHDNPHAHSLRLEWVMRLIAQRQKPVVAMEQFDRETQPALDLALTRCPDVDCVVAQVGSPGWEWRFYKPFVQLALDQKITLLAANLSNADVRKVMTGGFAAVYSPQAIAEYQLNQLPAPLLSLQSKAIQEGHCNMLPAQAIGPMVRGQIARDVWMASVVKAVQNPTVILIAGNGHVRKDAGVFQWLSPQQQAQTQIHAYVEQAEKSDADVFDRVHVVPTWDREDPCLVFQKKPAQK